jgi:pimeloyl-ACP methyl ester carboxylesterase
VPGATIHYTVRGTGPTLLIIQGGARDAARSEALARHLAPAFQVVAYDRRGLSRSRLDDPAHTVSIETHGEDAHRLLAAITDEPAFVFSSSLGALIALDLIATHPKQVRMLVAHEPIAAELLAEPERSRLRAGQRELQTAFRREGVLAAIEKLAAITGEAESVAPGSGKTPDLLFFLGNDAAAARRYTLKLPALRAAAGRIVPGAGIASRGRLLHRCAEGLAEHLHRSLVEFPGGHSGCVSVPGGFATTLRKTFAESAPPRHRTT